METLLKPAAETNILVVDDTPDNLRLLTKMLESQHYLVRKSLNGRMALKVAHHNPPDLILLDIRMPEMDGYEVCQQLKASAVTAHIPVIFISALDQIDQKVRGFEVGGQDYITKPFQELEVFARVKNQLLIQQQKQSLQQEIERRLQAELEVRKLNANLERQVQLRTLELQQALSFELALKQISDQVRDSLDPHQILQIAVSTLAQALEAQACHTTLYSPEPSIPALCLQWSQPGLQLRPGLLPDRLNFPELYEQLQNRSYVAFCQIPARAPADQGAILACPIFEGQQTQTGILGDLWLVRASHSSFSQMEIHLVQQVSNQCAIALRQARLYAAAQAQVQELERLNQLKDDFLSTISHELRTPIASMKMVLRLLSAVTDQGQSLVAQLSQASPNHKVVQYLDLLQEECDRELALVEDLLSLQQIEAGTYIAQPTPVHLQDLIFNLVEVFESRLSTQQQTLQTHLATDLPLLQLDVRSINRIISELLNNACKYTPAGETIAIAATVTPGPTPTHPVPALQLTVANTGVEIPPEEIPRIFDKFYRIPNNDPWKYGGTGLGLALVKKLVEKLGGSIAVESADLQTRFTVELALAG